MSRESFIAALNVIASEAHDIWCQLDEDPLWRWCAAYALETQAAIARELQCVALRDACEGADDAVIAFAAREYMHLKAQRHMAGEMRKAEQEVTALGWTAWAARKSNMKAPNPEHARTALDALQRALGYAAPPRAEGDDASEVKP